MVENALKTEIGLWRLKVDQLTAENQKLRQGIIDDDDKDARITLLPQEMYHQLVAENQMLKEQIEQREKAINAYGNNPAGFDWAVLDKIDRLERALKIAKDHIGYAGDCVEQNTQKEIEQALQPPGIGDLK